MSADLLRRAAVKLREHARAATAGPWEVGPNFGARDNTVYVRPEGGFDWIGSTYKESATKVMACQVANMPEFRANAAFVALMHPPVALALADLFEHIADDVSDANGSIRFLHSGPVLNDEYGAARYDWTAAVALARTILREPEEAS